jgi:anti-sigma B factor antagonist
VEIFPEKGLSHHPSFTLYFSFVWEVRPEVPPMPELLSQHKDDVLVVQFTSQKILSDVLIAQIGRELLELADEANGKMLLDFRGVTFMSSAMIGKIVLLNKKCKTNKTTIKLCNISSSIMEVFEITRLNKIFSIYDSEEDALAAFGKKGGWFG